MEAILPRPHWDVLMNSYSDQVPHQLGMISTLLDLCEENLPMKSESP